MSNQLISRVETITPMLAEEYLKHNSCNRQLRKSMVHFYASQMKKGQWVLNGETITFDEKGTLVNGQHRLSAIIQSGCSIEMLVVRNVPTKGSFETSDSGFSRKVTDSFYVKGIPYSTNVVAIIKRFESLKRGATVLSITGRKDGNTLSRQDLLNIYLEDEEFWQEIAMQSMAIYSVLRVLNSSEIGAYIAYLIKVKKHDRDLVYGFFEDMLKVDMPKK